MITTLTIIGILLVLGTIVSFAVKLFNPPPFNISTKVLIPLLVLGTILSVSHSMFFMAEQGHKYYVQYPTGGKTVHMNKRGITPKLFGIVTDWKDYLTITSEVNKKTSGSFPATPVRFSDKVTGTQQITVRFKLPDTEEEFVKLIDEFRTQENLINATLIPTVREVVSNSPYMFTGQGYASGEAPDYKYAVRDQLINGSYVLENKTNSSTKYEKINKDSLISIGGLEGPILTKTPKVNKSTGSLMRIKHAISNSGIIVTQVTLPDVDFKDTFDAKLEEQRKQSAKIQEYALSQRATIEETKLREAEGEKAKTVERLKQEKAAVKELIAVQTQLTRDSIQKERVEILNQIAKIEANTLKTKKDAESYANRKLVSAGITPQEKAYWEYKKDSVKYAYISKMNVPTNVIVGGSGNGSKNSTTEAMLQFKLMDDLTKK